MELDEQRPLKSLNRDELAFFSLGLSRNFGFRIFPIPMDPDFFGVFDDASPAFFGVLLLSTITVIEAWNHVEKLFSEAS